MPRCSIAPCGALAVVLACAALAGAHPNDTMTLARLQKLCPAELEALFREAEVGTPPTGRLRGRLLYLNDRNLPRLKVGISNALWRGKYADEDGYFANRWVGNVALIDSHYVIGPSWLDGRPAVLMEYPKGTPLFANIHDEVREVAPGVYLGPVYERCPCRKLRGFVALEAECSPRR